MKFFFGLCLLRGLAVDSSRAAYRTRRETILGASRTILPWTSTSKPSRASRVDVEDLPALAAKSGGADAAPAAVVREGRGCEGGRAKDSGWYGIVESSKEMTLQGGVGSVVRRGGKRNRRYG